MFFSADFAEKESKRKSARKSAKSAGKKYITTLTTQ
jgi:hypothetical protein